MMQIDGMIRTACPPERVVALLADPAALAKVVPPGCEVGAKTGESIAFVIHRKVGPITMNLHGHLILHKMSDPGGYTLQIDASHLIGGKVKLLLDLAAQEEEKVLKWGGTLESHGLAARLINDRAGSVQVGIKTLFQRLRQQIEGRKPAAQPAVTAAKRASSD
jgi:carbon monoxide dehydrogenase subunit G